MAPFKFLSPTLLFCLLAYSTWAQIAITDITKIPHLKNNVTYIVMQDTGSASAQPYKEIYRRHWTCSKIEFIEYKDILNYVSPDATFFSIGGYTTTSTFVHMTASGGSRNGLSYSNTHLYLELWCCNPKVLEKWKNRKKKKDELPDNVKHMIGRVELYTDFPTLEYPENIYQSDNDGDGHIRNWGPGYLKNDLQQLMALLEKEKEHSLFEGFKDAKQLKNLKKDTLYVPEYVLIKFNKFTGDESKRHEVEDLFGEYKFPYRLIGNEALNDKILNSTQPFYYLEYVKSSTDKYVSIINSQTGELVFSNYVPISYNLKDKDVERLTDEIKGKK